LCRACEQRFNNKGERWVLQNCFRCAGEFKILDVLKTARPITPLDDGAIYAGAQVSDVNVDALVYFAASVIWRAAARHWDSHDIGNQLSLGPYKEDFRLYLLGEAEFPKNAAVWVNVWRSPVNLCVLPRDAGCPRLPPPQLFRPGHNVSCLRGPANSAGRSTCMCCVLTRADDPLIEPDERTDATRDCAHGTQFAGEGQLGQRVNSAGRSSWITAHSEVGMPARQTTSAERPCSGVPADFGSPPRELGRGLEYGSEFLKPFTYSMCRRPHPRRRGLFTDLKDVPTALSQRITAGRREVSTMIDPRKPKRSTSSSAP
jgi:hypothetical protein